MSYLAQEGATAFELKAQGGNVHIGMREIPVLLIINELMVQLDRDGNLSSGLLTLLSLIHI